MKKKITIATEGERSVHIAFQAFEYGTLCGVDIDDPDQNVITETAAGEKVDCDACLQIWREATKWRGNDFSDSALRREVQP